MSRRLATTAFVAFSQRIARFTAGHGAFMVCGSHVKKREERRRKKIQARSVSTTVLSYRYLFTVTKIDLLPIIENHAVSVSSYKDCKLDANNLSYTRSACTPFA